MRISYNRLSVGDRLRLKRTLLGMSQDEMSEKIGRASKYYADIERGSCGMSIETLLALSDVLNMSLDYIMFGDIAEDKKVSHTDETAAVLDQLDHCSPKNREYALRMLKIFLIACDHSTEQTSEEIEDL